MPRAKNPTKVVGVRLPVNAFVWWEAKAQKLGKPVGGLLREELVRLSDSSFQPSPDPYEAGARREKASVDELRAKVASMEGCAHRWRESSFGTPVCSVCGEMKR